MIFKGSFMPEETTTPLHRFDSDLESGDKSIPRIPHYQPHMIHFSKAGKVNPRALKVPEGTKARPRSLPVSLPLTAPDGLEISKGKKPEKTESVLLKFLKEPELGTSWYNRKGPTPTFHDDQINGTVFASVLGDDVLLDCKVTAVEEDLVSWFWLSESFQEAEIPEALPVLLTVGFRPPYAGEDRFSLDFSPPYNYRLRINNVQWKDEGTYICQLAVHPPALLWTTLAIKRPLVHLLDNELNPVADLHYDVGATIEMTCTIQQPPLYQVGVDWTFTRSHKTTAPPEALENRASDNSSSLGTGQGNMESHHAVLNRDVTRGGVRVETSRDLETGLVVSKLSVAKAVMEDTGSYTCQLSGLPEGKNHSGLMDTVSVHVLRGENTKAIHSNRATGSLAFSVLLLLSNHLVSSMAQLSFCRWNLDSETSA